MKHKRSRPPAKTPSRNASRGDRDGRDRNRTEPDHREGGRSHGGRHHRGRSQGASSLWIFGTHPVLAALANPERTCRRLLVTAEAKAALGTTLEPLLRNHPRLGPPEVLPRDRISGLLPPGAVHQGIALEAAPLPPHDLTDVCRAAQVRADAFVVVLDQVEDPHNVGAVLRSAAAFGVLAVIVTERHAPGATGTLAKAASGALEAVPLVTVTNLARAIGDLKAAGFWVAGLDASAERTLAETDMGERVALVMGAEGKGLRRLTRESCDLLVRLPISSAVESLNVSVAAGIAMYELRRGKPAPVRPAASPADIPADIPAGITKS